jgi:hypothetical protein
MVNWEVFTCRLRERRRRDISVGKAGILLEIQNGHLGKGKVHTRAGHEGPEGE